MKKNVKKKPVLCQELKCNNIIFEKYKICKEHFEILKNSDMCYRLNTNGIKKGLRCNKPSKNNGLCGLHMIKQTKNINEKMKCRMIKLYPTLDQRQKLKQWFGVARKVYNKTLNVVKSKRKHSLNLVDLRPRIFKLLNKKKYILETPKEIRAEAINDYIKSHKNAILKYKTNKTISKLTYRSKKDLSQSIVPYFNSVKRLINENNRTRLIQFYSTKMNPIKTKEDIPEFSSCRIIMKNNKEFYLKADIKYLIPDKKIIDVNNSIALDPNEKNVFGYYSQREVGLIGENIRDINDPINNKISKLQSKLDSSKSKSYKKLLKNIILKQYTNRQHKRDDLHWKLSNYLVNNYDIIHIPKFEEHKKCQTLNRITNRRMFGICHSLFLQRLQYKSENQGTIVNVMSEEYTSKTCTKCGKLNKPNDREYKCKNCNLEIHRDINSSRNIYMKGVLGL